MKSTINTLLSVLLMAAGLACTQAHAGLLGANAKFEYGFPNAGDVYTGEGLAPQSAVVGSGVEFTTNYFKIDVQDDKIVYDLVAGWNSSVSHNGPRITFTGATIDTAALDLLHTSAAGDGLVFSWTTNYIDLDWKNYSGSHIEVNLSASKPSDVPEPASLCLLAAGLAAVGAARRRKTQR